MLHSIFLGLAVFGAIASQVHAAENMYFHGTLIEPPPCTINGGDIIDVNFGDKVGVNKVDGINYLEPINYRVNCLPGVGKWSMNLMVISLPPPDYDSSAIPSDVADLSIRVLSNGKPLELNKLIPVSPLNFPAIEVVPVKRPGVTLPEGPFVARATLLVAYQ